MKCTGMCRLRYSQLLTLNSQHKEVRHGCDDKSSSRRPWWDEFFPVAQFIPSTNSAGFSEIRTLVSGEQGSVTGIVLCLEKSLSF